MLLRYGQPAPAQQSEAPASATALARQVQALRVENAQLQAQVQQDQETIQKLIDGNAALIAKIQSIKEKMQAAMQARAAGDDAAPGAVAPDEVEAGPVVEMEAEVVDEEPAAESSGGIGGTGTAKKSWWRDEKVAGWSDADVEEEIG